MDAARQRALVRASAAVRKQKEKEGASSSAPKGVTKGTSKQKSDGKDDHPLKKGQGILAGDKKKPKQPSLLKPIHGAGKGLMTETNPVTQGAICHLLTHKEHVIEMIESIIKDKDLDPCAEQLIEDLGVSSLFDLARVCFSYIWLYFMLAS